MKSQTIFLLGPCYKLNRKSGQLYAAFDKGSRSGRLLHEILESQPSQRARVVFDNVLPTAYFNSVGQECNPKPSRLVSSLLSHRLWAEADTVVAFGSEVRGAFEIVWGTASAYSREKLPSLTYLQHPSYIMRRPKSERQIFATQLLAAFG